MPRDLINVIGTEILRSVAEIMDREFEKNGQKKIGKKIPIHVKYIACQPLFDTRSPLG